MAVVSCSYHSSIPYSSTTQVCSTSQKQLKVPTYSARHYSSRFHPYNYSRSTVNRSAISSSLDLTQLLQCQSESQYKHQPRRLHPVNSRVFRTYFDAEKPRFASYSFKKSTRADVNRLFGETSLTVSKDDIVDVVYTAKDVKQFDEKKRLAKELDEILDDLIVIDEC